MEKEYDFEPGDLIWAKLEGHPWWPCVICQSPQTLTHIKTNKQGQQVHVQFFYKPPSRAWIKARSIRPFKGKNVPECKRGGVFHNTKKTFSQALQRAEKAQFLTIKERLATVVTGQTYNKKGAEDNSDMFIEKKQRKRKPEETGGPPLKKKRMGPKSKIRKTYFDPEEIFIIGVSIVPRHWETPFVLMNTNDVPEDLTVDGFLSLKNKDGPVSPAKLPGPRPDDYEENLYDSDADPGWMPEKDKSYDVSDVSDIEEDLEDSDEDPGWSPKKGKKKKELEVKKPKRKFGIKKKKNEVKEKKSKTPPKPATSLKYSDPPVASTSSGSKTAPAVTAAPAPAPVPVGSVSLNQQSKVLVITDNTPTGPEPNIGDFILEKSECVGGVIPFLWRYKKGGLIQKYEKLEENGLVLYENVQSFSDWWACYAHKYQKVNVQIRYKFRNKEKVVLLEQPVIEDAVPVLTTDMAASTSSDLAEKTQEQEISSTTPEPEFQIGQFVIDIKDKRNVDNFPVWKIESQILLKKYQAIIKNGKMLHRPVKTYRGYRDINKYYIAVKVKKIPDISGDEFVEVSDDTKPKLYVNASMEEEYDKNPLLRHFYVYLQVFLSQALEPGFLDEIKNTKDETYLFPLGEVDKIISQKLTNIERKVRWTHKLKTILHKSPYLREVHKPDENKTCEGMIGCKETVEEVVFLFGSDYNQETLKQSGTSNPCQDFRIGKTATRHISAYHQLAHFKYNLYDKCLAKIKMTRDSKEEEMDVTEIMDECLGNKTWVLQNFEDFMKLVEMCPDKV